MEDFSATQWNNGAAAKPGCQIFLGTTYQKTGKLYQMTTQ
jgi:hypothetical protein